MRAIIQAFTRPSTENCSGSLNSSTIIAQGTISPMGGLLQPNLSSGNETSESTFRPVLIGIVIVVVVVGVLVFLFRPEQPRSSEPSPYAANLSFSGLKASAAQNFAGATVNYLDGEITNNGSQTVIHAVVQVTFKDDIGQTAQKEDVPIHVLRTGGPYDEAVDLNMSPLMPGQTKPFRLTFEDISAQWNHAYPDMRVTSVATK
jgi:hypothetical protein